MEDTMTAKKKKNINTNVANVAFLPTQPIGQRQSPLTPVGCNTGVIASGLNRMMANAFVRANNPLEQRPISCATDLSSS